MYENATHKVCVKCAVSSASYRFTTGGGGFFYSPFLFFSPFIYSLRQDLRCSFTVSFLCGRKTLLYCRIRTGTSFSCVRTCGGREERWNGDKVTRHLCPSSSWTCSLASRTFIHHRRLLHRLPILKDFGYLRLELFRMCCNGHTRGHKNEWKNKEMVAWSWLIIRNSRCVK